MTNEAHAVLRVGFGFGEAKKPCVRGDSGRKS